MDAKVIYCFKIYLFRELFQLAVREKKNLAESAYSQSTCMWELGSHAPLLAIHLSMTELVKQIKLYRIVKQGISDAAMCKLKNHLWYVGPELILLSLFSDKLSEAQKRSIVESMKNCEENWNERGIKLENCDGKSYMNWWLLHLHVLCVLFVSTLTSSSRLIQKLGRTTCPTTKRRLP